MNAAAERLAIATAGRELVAARGGAGERRAAALLARPAAPPSTAFAALLDAPHWLRWPAARQVRLAQVVALRSVASALARSIDGVWLGALAEVAGEDAIDWAIARGAGEEHRATPPVAPAALAARGFAILRADLPAALRGCLSWAPHDDDAMPAAPTVVAEAVAFVAERPA